MDKETTKVTFKTSQKRSYEGDNIPLPKKYIVDDNSDNEGNDNDDDDTETNIIVGDNEDATSEKKEEEEQEEGEEEGEGEVEGEEEEEKCKFCGNQWDGYAQCFPCIFDDVE